MKKLIFSSVIVCATLAFMLSTSTSTQSLDNMLENVFYDTAIARADDELDQNEICHEDDFVCYIEWYCILGGTDCSPSDCPTSTDG